MKTAAQRVALDKDFYRSSMKPRYALQPGMRLWANALGLRLDPYRSCPNCCQYCVARFFADAMSERAKGYPPHPRLCRCANINAVRRQFEAVFEEGKLWPYDWVTWALSKRFFVEVGCLGEPMQAPDLKYRVTWNVLSLMQKYGVPLYLNTKGNLLVADESYYQHLLKVPIKVVDISLSGMDDKVLHKIDAKAPLASERLALMARLKRDGVPVVASVRPIIKGVSDADWEGFMRRLVDIGVNSIHVRTLVMVGKLLKRPKWRRHAEEHMQQFSGEWRYPKEYFLDLYGRAARVCEGSGTRVVGTRRYWFDLDGFHGKAAFDHMSSEIQDHLFPYSVIPILRAIKQRQDAPQLLTWDNLGYHGTDVPMLRLGGHGGNQAALVFNDWTAGNWKKKYLVSGGDFVRLGLWEGFVPLADRPAGEMLKVERIYPVVNGDGKMVFDGAGHSVLAYVPPALANGLVKEYDKPRRDAVLWDDAKGFHIPERNTT